MLKDNNWQFNSLGSLLFQIDCRLKIIIALVMGILTWSTGSLGLLVYLAMILGLTFVLLEYMLIRPKTLLSIVGFILFWVGLKTIFEVYNGIPVWKAVNSSGLLGTRLTVLVVLGLILTASTSKRQLVVAINWFLGPILGKKSWQGALCLTLLIHYLPLSLRTFNLVKQNISLRLTRLHFFKKCILLIQTTLRILGTETWKQTIGLASRNLDRQEVWQEKIPFVFGHWLGAGLILIFILGLSLI